MGAVEKDVLLIQRILYAMSIAQIRLTLE